MLSPGDRRALEAEVRGLCERADLEAALERTLRGYGPEVYGLLVALHDGEQDAQEVFSLWSEDLWRGLPGFAWRSSLRTWCYVLARHASHRYRESPRTPHDPLSSSVLEIAERVRTATGSFLDPDKRDKLAEMRASLPPEDRELLVLHLDRELPWDEVATVMLGDGAAEDDAAVVRESARLRKRFQLLKERLIEQGRQAGMIGRRGT
jgi:RNA polymerase sigma-70 factor (ECF subfamily)